MLSQQVGNTQPTENTCLQGISTAVVGQCLLATWLGRIPYRNAHATQLSLVEKRAAGSAPDMLLLLEHPPTITCGRGTDASEVRRLLADERACTAEIAECERGGKLTFHGPGQLVAYPIVHLDAVGRDLHRWLWVLEEAAVRAIADLGLCAGRSARGRGVWVKGLKVASIGVAVRHWVSYHGIAVNVSGRWPRSVPISWCGLEPEAYGSLADCGLQVELSHLGRVLASRLAELCGLDLQWAEEGWPSARRGVQA
ncbi:MAG: lipoyl(octanoyl) transferase LipB [Armatimonadota bacterium]